MTNDWNHLPPILVTTPVLALAAGPDGLWASGPGGVAWHPSGSEWHSRISGLPLTDVAALVYTGGWLIAGGAEGIARSKDGGLSWQAADILGDATAVAAIVASPSFREDTTALAATLGGGIIRSEDAGRSWKPATFGLQEFEVIALAWGTGEQLLAATSDGVYRSPNAGRAWRLGAGSEGEVIAAVAFLPDGTALAALEQGGLLRSNDTGETWQPWGDLPAQLEATALHVTPEGVILLGSTGGALRSLDGGQSWAQILDQPIYTFAADANSMYAGTAEGIVGLWADMAANPDTPEWRSLDRPPLHDLRRLHIVDGQPLVAGIRTPPVVLHNGEWQALDATPLPLSALTHGPHATLWTSSPAGLHRSTNGGYTFTTVIAGAAGSMARITFRPDGSGFAGSADGQRLLRTSDGGTTWQQLASPFGVLPLAALQAMPGLLIGGTYDPRRKIAQLWRSFDEGQNWERGSEVQTDWPVVATSAAPPLITLGGVMFRHQNRWDRLAVGTEPGGVRRIIGGAALLLALTTTGVYRSEDDGVSWQHDDDGLPVAQVMDIAIDGATLYVLMAGGLVWTRAL
ncbi:MAG: hypothetical protein H7Z42_05070 [Roseiflexaceae bacterium]|nr:hypothetical protein [Roseiflexaceae bacterium]